MIDSFEVLIVGAEADNTPPNILPHPAIYMNVKMQCSMTGLASKRLSTYPWGVSEYCPRLPQPSIWG